MAILRPLPDLHAPEAEIRARANGDMSAAIQLAAAYGYAVACRDLDRIAGIPSPLASSSDV